MMVPQHLWSSEIDQLASGTSGAKKIERLLLVSAGNTNKEICSEMGTIFRFLIYLKMKSSLQHMPGTRSVWALILKRVSYLRASQVSPSRLPAIYRLHHGQQVGSRIGPSSLMLFSKAEIGW